MSLVNGKAPGLNPSDISLTDEQVSVLKMFLRMSPELKSYKLSVAILAISVLLTVAINFSIPLVIKTTIDILVTNHNALFIKKLILFIVATVIIGYFLKLFVQYKTSQIKEKIFLTLQIRLFSHIHDLPVAFHSSNDIGYLMARIRSDIASALGLLADNLLSLMINVLMFFAGLGLCLYFNPKLTILSVCILPFYGLSIRLPNRHFQALNQDIQERNAKTMQHLQEALDTIPLMKLLGRAAWQTRRLHRVMSGEVRARIRLVVFSASIGKVADLITNLGVVSILGYGAALVSRHELSVGELMAYLSFFGFMLSSVGSLIGVNIELQLAAVGANRIFKILDMRTEHGGSQRAILDKNMSGISFRHVSCAYYGGRQVLRDINLDVESNLVTVIVGRSGAGKSTLVNLLVRFYEPEEGSILFNGIPINEINLSVLRRNIGLITHAPRLISGTILENICLGRQIDPELLQLVVKTSCIHEFIDPLEKQFSALIGHGGSALSVGQSQRIALARLLVEAPKTLIIDEGLSGVDSETEGEILQNLKHFWPEISIIMVSHRLATIQRADQIVLMDEGRIVQQGNHNDLYRNSPFYRDLCSSRKFESLAIPGL